MREIKEVRATKNSKEFNRWLNASSGAGGGGASGSGQSTPVDAAVALTGKKNNRCFVIYHGSDFNLQTFSVMAISETECDQWVSHLIQAAQKGVFL